MKKVYVFILGVIVGMVITFASLYTAMYIGNGQSEAVPIDTIEVLYRDSTCFLPDPYMGMTEEEFMKEMTKGVQGDYTLEQVDSMRRSWEQNDSVRKAP